MSTNAVTPQGVTIQTLPDIVNEILNGSGPYPGLLQIYGAALNYNPNSPDGNMVNIYAQGKIDVLELCVQINSQFDPDQAVGINLDARCAINGVTRQAGTFTQQPVTISFSAIATLPGLDLNPNGGAFTVQDVSGNLYGLLQTYTSAGAGAVSLSFQAVAIGSINSALNSITTIATPQLGVISANNPAAATSIGINEETDSALRIRRANSVELPSIGYFEGLVGALLDTVGVNFAKVIENNTTGTVNGTPAHSIWVIVSASSANEADADFKNEIAEVIYVKRNAGCGMRGTVIITIPTIDGGAFAAYWDWATQEPLYFECTATAITGTLDKPAMAAAILAQFGNFYGIGVSAAASQIVAFLNDNYPNASISSASVSNDGSTWVNLLAPTNVNYQLEIPDVSHITVS